MSAGSVSEWEAGNTEPTHENLARVAVACGITLAEFWAAPLVILPGEKAAG